MSASPATECPAPRRRSALFVLSAPSGAGKTTICRALLQADPRLAYSVSTTTRPMRPGETPGVSYDFVSSGEFEQLRARGVFVECAQYLGNWYGTRRDRIEAALEAGRDVLMDIEIVGARQLRQAVGERAVFIFILPPSWKALEQRLRARGADDAAAIERRLRRAREEMDAAPEFDYIIVNDDLPTAVADAQAIVRAERLRQRRTTWQAA